MLDISPESEVIHRNSVHLLLPTIFIKNKKEQLPGRQFGRKTATRTVEVPVRHGKKSHNFRGSVPMQCNCVENSFSQAAIWQTQLSFLHKLPTESYAQPWIAVDRDVKARNVAFKKIQQAAKYLLEKKKKKIQKNRKIIFSVSSLFPRAEKGWQLSIQRAFAGRLRTGGCGTWASMAALRAWAACTRGEISCASGRLCQ